ncbi:hypothetical protein K438DRAFT_1749185 [Mycena galopus ATCC 62051]|nr:hypothetical protein K438DRAFT_1749185 [Mycena galopus ATCC 62051]
MHSGIWLPLIFCPQTGQINPAEAKSTEPKNRSGAHHTLWHSAPLALQCTIKLGNENFAYADPRKGQINHAEEKLAEHKQGAEATVHSGILLPWASQVLCKSLNVNIFTYGSPTGHINPQEAKFTEPNNRSGAHRTLWDSTPQSFCYAMKPPTGHINPQEAKFTEPNNRSGAHHTLWDSTPWSNQDKLAEQQKRAEAAENSDRKNYVARLTNTLNMTNEQREQWNWNSATLSMEFGKQCTLEILVVDLESYVESMKAKPVIQLNHKGSLSSDHFKDSNEPKASVPPKVYRGSDMKNLFTFADSTWWQMICTEAAK